MTQEKTLRFVGRAIVIDPLTDQDSEYSAYVCVLLTGPGRQPSITLGEAADVDSLLMMLVTDELNARFKDTKLSFEPPPGDYPITHSSARQRYEALGLQELYRVQTILSGR